MDRRRAHDGGTRFDAKATFSASLEAEVEKINPVPLFERGDFRERFGSLG
jgi:hypothetical protein